MKNFFLTAVAVALGSLTVQAAPFAPTNVVIYRVGDGSAALTSAGTAVFLDEYTPGGQLVQSYALPTAAAGTTLPFVASGSASSEGFLNTSADGRFLVLTGYNTAVGTAGVASTTTATVPREVATVSATGALVQTSFNNFSGTNIRSAASADGSTLYVAGNQVGIVSVASSSTGTTGTLISSTSTNNRTVYVANGQLYLSTSSGTTLRIATVGAGLPTTAGQTATEVTGIPVSSTAGVAVNGPTAFFVTSLGTTGDTIYVADNGNNAIEKFSFAAGTFTLTGTVTLAGVTGLTGRLVAGTEQIFATTAAGLFLLTDLSGAGGTLAGTPTQLATASTNTAFRGIALAPIAVPEPTTLALLALGGAGFAVALRRRTAASVA